MSTAAPSWSISAMPVTATVAAAELLHAGFPEDQLVTGVAVGIAESSLNAAVISPLASDNSRGYGLWQIEYPTHNTLFPGGNVTGGGWILPANNAKMAYSVYGEQGWHAWTTYFTGMYTAHLPEATMAVAALNQAAQSAKLSLADYAAKVSTADTASFTPALSAIGLGQDIGTATTTAGNVAGAAGQGLTDLYQGYSGPEAGNPLLRVAEIVLGGVLLVVGLSKLASPVVAPIASTATKLIP